MMGLKGSWLAVAVVSAIILVDRVAPLDNGLSKTPAMGFNTWNTFYCDISEGMIKDLMAKFVELGLRDAGYKYFNLDDCWHAPERNKTTKMLQPHPDRFPSGIASLSKLAHSMNLSFGIYSDAGVTTCAGFPGSLGYEVLDAQTFASWGVDYLKYDNCGSGFTGLTQQERYIAMRNALNSTKRPIVYSMCSWGVDKPWEWAAMVGNSWRTTGDIRPEWDSVLSILDHNLGLARYAGPGGWNDPDMLEVGNMRSLTEERAHFAIWALLKSPLLIGADLRNISNASLAILKNQALIAVNQDPLGIAGDVIAKTLHGTVLAGPISGGGRVLIMLNRHSTELLVMSVDLATIGYGGPINLKVTELYSNASYMLDSHEVDALGCQVGPHAVCVLRMLPTHPTPDMDNWRPWASSPPPVCRTTSTGGFLCRSRSVEGQAASAGSSPATHLLWQGSNEEFVTESLPAIACMPPKFTPMLLACIFMILAVLAAKLAVHVVRQWLQCCKVCKGCCKVGVEVRPLHTVTVGEAGVMQPLLAQGKAMEQCTSA